VSRSPTRLAWYRHLLNQMRHLPHVRGLTAALLLRAE
jgi:hypothetical protein